MDSIHWTVSALILSSLVSGLFSVVFACEVQLALGRLQNPGEALTWLTSPIDLTYSLVSNVETYNDLMDLSADAKAESQYLLLPTLRVPSATSAMLLTSPTYLLRLSIFNLLLGMALYLGLLYKKDMGSLRGNHANLAVLLIFVLVTAFCYLQYALPHWIKSSPLSSIRHQAMPRILPTTPKKRAKVEQALLKITQPLHDRLFQRFKELDTSVKPPDEPPKDDTILSKLVLVQEETTKLQKEMLELQKRLATQHSVADSHPSSIEGATVSAEIGRSSAANDSGDETNGHARLSSHGRF